VTDPSGAWTGPVPDVDPISAPYWAAAAEGRLLVQECPACGHRQHYPRAVCTLCAATPEWLETSGRGTVYTFTIVRQYNMPPFATMVPYVVAMIELPEGPRVLGHVTDCDPAEVRIGAEVQMYAVHADDGIGIPMWRLAA